MNKPSFATLHADDTSHLTDTQFRVLAGLRMLRYGMGNNRYTPKKNKARTWESLAVELTAVIGGTPESRRRHLREVVRLGLVTMDEDGVVSISPVGKSDHGVGSSDHGMGTSAHALGNIDHAVGNSAHSLGKSAHGSDEEVASEQVEQPETEIALTYTYINEPSPTTTNVAPGDGGGGCVPSSKPHRRNIWADKCMHCGRYLDPEEGYLVGKKVACGPSKADCPVEEPTPAPYRPWIDEGIQTARAKATAYDAMCVTQEVYTVDRLVAEDVLEVMYLRGLTASELQDICAASGLPISEHKGVMVDTIVGAVTAL